MLKKLSAVLIAALFILIPLGIAPTASASPDDESTQKLIDEYVEDQMKEGQIPGLALGIMENGEVICLKGYGKADDSGAPVTPQTPFIVGSVGKMFTALAIRQIKGLGKIDYNATVQTYIPWFTLADAKAASQIRIIDLTSHRSGLSTASGVEAWTYNGKYSAEDIVRKLSRVMPDQQPGTTEEYSNLNFIILGAVIDQVSGMSYGEYIQKNIFDPLGMKNSYPSQAAAGRWAQGHTVAFGLTMPDNEPMPTGQVSAGFQVTCAEDLLKFASLYLSNGYYNGKSIIPANDLPEANKPFKETDVRYGNDWVPEVNRQQNNAEYYGYAGATSGFTSTLLVNSQSARAIVVLANCRNNACTPEISAQTIGNGVASILRTGQIPPPMAHSKPGLWINICVAAAVLALLVFRAFWAKRFKRNIAKGGARKVFGMISFILLDVLLPVAALAGLPFMYDINWPFVLNSNMEFGGLVFFSAILLAAIGAAKITMVVIYKSQKNRREHEQAI